MWVELEECEGRDREQAIGNNCSDRMMTCLWVRCFVAKSRKAVAVGARKMMRKNKAEPEGDSATRRAFPAVLGVVKTAAWKTAAASILQAKVDRRKKTR